jgi:gliding motility-associated-like protein
MESFIMRKISLSFLFVVACAFVIQSQNINKISEKTDEVNERQALIKIKQSNNSNYLSNNLNNNGSPKYYKNNKKAKTTSKTNQSNKKTIITVHANSVNSTPCSSPSYTGTALSFPNNSLPNDDGTETIAFPFNFCFYGQSYNSCNVSINGNIQFVSNDDGYTAAGFPSNTVDMIAPFWADIDLNGIGTVNVDVFPTRMVISWDSVGRYDALTDLYNSFQCVITDGTDPILPPGKNVGFYYKKMTWANEGATPFGGNASTIGINAGNNVDYFLIGRFNQLGNNYIGPNALNNGVGWLDGKKFFFNVCPGLGENIEPIASLIQPCQTFTVCGNDTLAIKEIYLAPEVSQTSTVTAASTSLGSSLTYSTLTTNNSTTIYMFVDGNTATSGVHTITITATDDGVPALTSVQVFDVLVDQVTVNNLNGGFVFTPTIGICPGETTTVSLNINGGIPDNYYWNNGETSSSTSFTPISASDSLIFVTVSSGQCQKTITGNILINPTPVATITGNLSYCTGDASSTVLTVTNSLNPVTQAPHTYNWAATTGTISSLTTSTVEVNYGVYTATVSNKYGCNSIATTTVIMKESPSYTLSSLNATAGGSVYCINQDTARYNFAFSTSSSPNCDISLSPCSSSSIILVGTGTSTTSSSLTNPFISFWESSRHQYLYLASELTASGVQPGKISSIAFDLATLSTETLYPGFTVKIKCTSASATSSIFDNNGLNLVYSANTTINLGINTINFNQPYIWDGVSNILIDICHDLTSGIPSNSKAFYTTTTFNSVVGDYDSGSGSLCGVEFFPSTSKNRPNIHFGNCLASQNGSQFNITVTPTVAVSIPSDHTTINFGLPSNTSITCYTVSLTNPIGGCSKDTVICISAVQGVTEATLSISANTTCLGNSVTLTPLGALESYTIAYNNGSGIVNSANTPVSFNSSVLGINTFTLTGNGFCGAPITSFTNTINTYPVANISIIDSAAICSSTNFTLNANSSGSTNGFTYSWFILPSSTSLSSSTILNTLSPESEGIYTVSIVATDKCGNTDYDTQLITVLPPCGITIPNVLTNNGDGINDVFKITNIEHHPNSELIIFDRWGRKVYENKNYSNNWKGESLSSGTYFYVLNVPDDKKYSGFITIFKGQ